MQEMNPYYAHDSAVGPVFDAATWNTRWAFATIMMALGMFVVFSVAGYVFYDPTLLAKFDGEVWRDLQSEIGRLWRNYPLYSQIGLAVAGFLAYLGLTGAVSTVIDCSDPDFFLRVGAGGISLRVPDGLDFRKLGFVSRILRLDLPWQDVAQWTVTQTKQLGSMSPHAGNISAKLTVRTTAGKKYVVNLDHFRENGHLIWKRIGEAADRVPAQLDVPTPTARHEQPLASGPQETRTVIETVLIKQLYSPTSAAVFSDAATGKFVQFAVGGGDILLDLPAQALNDAETARAGDYFAALGEELQSSELLDRPGGIAVGVQQSYQIELHADVERAAALAMDIFSEVYGLPEDFELTIETL